MSERAGLVLATDAGRVFVPATLAAHVVHLGMITEVPGLPPPALGVALAEGRLATVIALGTPRERGSSRPAIVCDVDGDVVALVGGLVLAMGSFAGASAGVLHEGAFIPDLDARALYAEIEGTLWAARTLELTRRGKAEGEAR